MPPVKDLVQLHSSIIKAASPTRSSFLPSPPSSSTGGSSPDPASSPLNSRVGSRSSIGGTPSSPTASRGNGVVDLEKVEKDREGDGEGEEEKNGLGIESPPAVVEEVKEKEEEKKEVDSDDEEEGEGEGELEEGELRESMIFPVRATTPVVEEPEAEATAELESTTTTTQLPTPPPSTSSTPVPTPCTPTSQPQPQTTTSNGSGLPSATSDSPLAKIVELLPELSIKDQEKVRKNIERLSGYPRELPLSSEWTLYFSDTSSTPKASHHSTTQAQYTESHRTLFTTSTVPSLCGSLKALKRLSSSTSSKPRRASSIPSPSPSSTSSSLVVESLGINHFRAGQNLHFFKSESVGGKKISPTWEDPWSEKGGRLTISPSNGMMDSVYERLVLLLAGEGLEESTREILSSSGGKGGKGGEGSIVGVVAARRARGDRIELWLGGKMAKTAPGGEWIDALKQALSESLEMPELRTGKYKKHFA